MIADLVTLPIRLSARAATLLLRGTEGVVNEALGIAGRVARHGVDDEPDFAVAEPEPGSVVTEPDSGVTESDSVVAEAETVEGPEIVSEPRSEAETDRYAETPPEPPHVSEEATLVQESAEPGAEDGAGAQVRIDEPWGGYAQMSAKDVIERVTVADAAQLAAIGLYERANQNRQTVLSAVERQLQLSTRGNSDREQ